MSLYSYSGHFSYKTFYTKAQEIFSLSQHIGNYMVEDLMHLQEDGSEDAYVYVSGDIIQQSQSLGFEILKAEKEHSKTIKQIHAHRLNKLISRLNRTCLRLEKSRSNGRDFLPILRNEIKKFIKMQQLWMVHL